MSLSDVIDNLINKSETTGLGFGELLTEEDRWAFQKEIFQILPIENQKDVLSLFESKFSNQELREKFLFQYLLKLTLIIFINLIIWELLF